MSGRSVDLNTLVLLSKISGGKKNAKISDRVGYRTRDFWLLSQNAVYGQCQHCLLTYIDQYARDVVYISLDTCVCIFKDLFPC